MFKEFKEFALRGNVIDMAVGLIIAGAFGKIVSSLVKDVIMPPVGMMMGGVNFKDLYINLTDVQYDSLAKAVEAGAPVIQYGSFLNTIIDFVVLAFIIFMMVRAINKAQESMKKEEEAKEAPAEPPKQEVLLEEIRDLLKK